MQDKMREHFFFGEKTCVWEKRSWWRWSTCWILRSHAASRQFYDNSANLRTWAHNCKKYEFTRYEFGSIYGRFSICWKKEAKFTELERKFQIHFYFKRALYATINLSFAKKKILAQLRFLWPRKFSKWGCESIFIDMWPRNFICVINPHLIISP